MTTVADIAAEAFGAVALEITDAIHSATLTRTTQGAYTASTGAYAVTTASQTGRAVSDQSRPIADVFPHYVVGPADELFLLEGFTSCVENDALSVAGRSMIVRQVLDIANAGSLFYVVAR